MPSSFFRVLPSVSEAVVAMALHVYLDKLCLTVTVMGSSQEKDRKEVVKGLVPQIGHSFRYNNAVQVVPSRVGPIVVHQSCWRWPELLCTPRPVHLPTTTFFSRCPNLTIKIQREGESLVLIISATSAFFPLLKFTDVCTGSTADDHLNQPSPSAPIPSQQPLPQGESNFGDSSGPLFTIYSRHAENAGGNKPSDT